MHTLRTAIVGCGNIAGSYVEHIKTYPGVEIAGFADVDASRAQVFAAKHGGRAYTGLDAVLADPAVDCVINLTIHHAHYEVIGKCLRAGKHVHSEKPLAMTYREARELVDLAAARNVRLSCAPVTYLGEAQQTAARLLREGVTGPVRLVYAEINHGRIESWHPNPKPFYDVGVMWDVGVYPLSLLTALLGPAARVSALGKIVHPQRRTLAGETYAVTIPDFIVAMVEFASGPTLRLSTNFYHAGGKQGSAVEFVGDAGVLWLESAYMFDARVERAAYGKSFEPVPLARPGFAGIEFGRGVQELATAIAENRPHRASGAHAAHVVELIEGIHNSLTTGSPVALTSTFEQPALMPWA
ncbi:MAG TPA: Gfo/Idh/MocA family oxidoreductase [Opitutaceae bacterium]